MKEQNKKFKYTKRKSSFLRTSYLRLQKGFTLIEVIVAIFVLTIGVIGILSLVNQTIISSQIISSRLVASYLAQEGIEIVKNIRDTNSLEIHKGLLTEDQWIYGLTGCESGCEADYNDSILVSANRYLKIDGGFYNYDSGNDTIFKRKITIFDVVDLDVPPDEIMDKMKVQVEVSWTERLRTYQVTAQENIYKWMQ
jgi:prepilin-type N-terminal cleavage/methylation domain-containing protein